MKTLTIALLLLLTLPAAAAEDACRMQIPASLQVALSKAFPRFRAPLAADNLPNDNEWDLNNGGKECLGVAIGDFDGDAASDVLLGLTSLHEPGGLVVVALARGKTWRLHPLDEWPYGRATLYVSTAEPGSYERTESSDGPLEPGEVDVLECPHAVAIFGQIDSSGVAYCYNHEKWLHAWVSD